MAREQVALFLFERHNRGMNYYDFAVKTVTDAAARSHEAKQKEFSIEHKHDNPKDVVTSIDRQIGQWITNRIKTEYQDHAIWNEEAADVSGNNYTWTIDPIDGSANFSRHIPHYAISLGLLEGDRVIVGAIIDPSTGELFAFDIERGVFLNGHTVSVSKEQDLARASVLFAAGRRDGLAAWAGASYTKLLQNVNKTKNLGSSALDIAYVAAGRAEAYIAGTLTTRDIAPALAMVEAAGGVALSATGEPLSLSSHPQKVYIANSDTTARALIELLEA